MSINSLEQFEKPRACGMIVGKALRAIAAEVRAGVTTAELCEIGSRLPPIVYGFPGDVCISLNDEVVHGIPGEYSLVTHAAVRIRRNVHFARRGNGIRGPRRPEVAS